MTNSDDLFYSACVFQRERAEITDRYEKRIAELQLTAGSSYFDAETEAAAKARDDALAELQKDYRRRFMECIAQMRSTNGKRGVKAPSSEELNVLQVLKMREHVSMNELDEIAHTLAGNALALSVLQEVAQQHGIARNYRSFYTGGDTPVETVGRSLDALEAGLEDFLMFDTPKIQRMYRSHYTAINGTNADATPLPKRRKIINKSDIFSEFAGLTGDELAAFYRAVDSEA